MSSPTPELVASSGRGAKIRRRVGNVAALLTNDAVQRGITFVIYALIARYLGAVEFGQLSVTLAIYYLLLSLAPVGIKILVMREVARDRSLTDKYLLNGSLVAMLSALLAIDLLLVFLYLMKYSQATVDIVLLVSVGLFPASLSAICEAVFQAWEKMHYVTIANVPIQLGRGIAAYLLLSRQGDIYAIGYIFVATTFATLLMEWALILWKIRRPAMRFDLRFSLNLFREAAAFLGLQSVIALTGSILPILLTKLSGEAETGFYNAANQLMAPVILVCQSVVMGLFPAMCRRHDQGAQPLRTLSEQIIEMLNLITIPAAVGLYVLAEPILLLLYGNQEFATAANVIRITALTLVIKGLTSVLGRVLLAGQHERVLLRILLIEMVSHIGLVVILVSQAGLTGAALAALLTAILEWFLHGLAVKKVTSGIGVGGTFWKPVLASLGMAGLLMVGLNIHIHLLLNILVGGSAYISLWLLVSILSAGGMQQFKNSLARQWSE